MSLSISEFAVLVLVAAVLFAGVLHRYPWVQWVVAAAILWQVASLLLGGVAGGMVLAAALGIGVVRHIMGRRNNSPAG